MKKGSWVSFVAGCGLAVFVLVSLGCSDEQDASDIAKALDERLTDALDFTGGEVVDGAAPQGLAGEQAPQIGDLGVPSSLTMAESFDVNITPEKTDDPVENVIVQVGEAARHIRVPVEEVEGEIRLRGKLAADAQLEGERFAVRVALQTAQGVTGLYKDWSFTVEGEKDSGAEAIRRGCDKVHEFCPEGYEMTQNVESSGQCQSMLVCIKKFYADDARCLSLLQNGLTCIEALESSDGCATCDGLITQLRTTHCEEPAECYP